MVNVVGICVALFLLAAGFVVLTEMQEIAALFNSFLTQPPALKAAWAVVVLAPIAALALAAWLSYTLMHQRRAAAALERRLGGARRDVNTLAKSQVDADTSLHHLARTDPEDSIGALQQRLSEAERFLHVQQNRNEMGGLQSRVNDIRAQQQTLQERLAPVLDKRRMIEQLFAELDTRENDINRSLAEIATGDDAVGLDTRMKNIVEFVRAGHARCDEIEHASKAIANLKEDFLALQNRIAPFVAAEGGITSRVKELRQAGDKLETTINSLQQTPEGALAERMQRFADDKKRLDDGLSHLTMQFSSLVTLRKDIDGLFANFDHTLDMLAMGSVAAGGTDVDSRIEALWNFIKQTQTHLDDIEQRMVVFGQLKARLGELQSRLVPLENNESGVVSLIEQLRDVRDRLVSKIRHIEHDDEGDLAERVRKFSETKRELEERVSGLADQFAKLASIRKDIAGLFEKLSSAVSASSN
jgi:predicted  nucleic acid-binding Zn-ribbon protein